MICKGEGMTVLPQVSVAYTRLLYQFWTRHGVPKVILDDILQLDIYQDSLTEFSVSSRQSYELHQAAVKFTRDSSLGIKLGIYLAELDFIISKLFLTSLNLESALDALLDYSRVISESGCFYLNDHQQQSQILGFTPHEGIKISDHQHNMVLAMVVTWIKKILPNDYQRIDFYCNEKTASSAEYLRLLGCNVVVGRGLNIAIPNDLLNKENHLADANAHKRTLKQIKKISEKRIEGLDFYENVQQAIKQCLLERRANQENVADLLDITVRNLQRRLKNLGTNYQSILDESRESLAMNLLDDADVALTDICYLLGFAEPSAFYKAFRRWTGKRPGDYRQDAIKPAASEV